MKKISAATCRFKFNKYSIVLLLVYRSPSEATITQVLNAVVNSGKKRQKVAKVSHLNHVLVAYCSAYVRLQDFCKEWQKVTKRCTVELIISGK